MIKSTLTSLTNVEALERLLVRLPAAYGHREHIEKHLHRAAAGVRGEERLQRKFKEFYLEEKFEVLWDISFKLGEWAVQLDGVLLTENCAVVIKSKNISGEIHYEEKTEEFFRNNADGEKTILENPVIQLKKNIRFLKRWLKWNYIELSITGLIVFTAKNCEFRSKPPGAVICKTYQMNEYLYQILQSYSTEVSSHQVTSTKNLLAAGQTPYKHTPLCELHRIEPNQLKKGIFCPSCKTNIMKRDKGGWNCEYCGRQNRVAHQLALQEYFALINDSLTNKQFCDFGKINSPALVRHMLSHFDLGISGNYKSRFYYLKKNK